MKMVKIRFNTNYGKLPNQKKWRLLIEGTAIFADEIELHCPCHTSEDIVVGDDGKLMRFKDLLNNENLFSENESNKIMHIALPIGASRTNK